MLYPRSLAVRVLTSVLSDFRPLDESLAALTGEITSSQRAWLQEVCAGTLRWKGRLDLAIDSSALKKKPTGWLRKVLLIAAYQLIVQERTQPSAVVFETVAEVKKKEGEAPARFANAVLRKIAAHAREWREMPAPAEGAAPEEAAQWASLPVWFWKRLSAQRGHAWATAFAQACLDRPALWVRARRADWKPEWAEPGAVPLSWKVREAGRIDERAGFTEGEFIVQDISSQVLLSEISTLLKEHGLEGAQALDLCAAPGGKAVGLSWNGFSVSATDRDESRLSLLRQTASRAASTIRVLARSEVAPLPLQDLVWVDAPCMGTGIIRRHPDVRWLKREQDISQLLKIQEELLSEAWQKVRPGGYLVYSVCSVLAEEGPEMLQRLKLRESLVREWLLCPQEAPYGDGFWAGILRKSVSGS